MGKGPITSVNVLIITGSKLKKGMKKRKEVNSEVEIPNSKTANPGREKKR